jgi:hypothetical protein
MGKAVAAISAVPFGVTIRALAWVPTLRAVLAGTEPIGIGGEAAAHEIMIIDEY